MADHEELVLKQYSNWTLYLASDQYYLGRAYAWLNRPGEMQRLSGLNRFERDELFEKVMLQYEDAVAELFRPDHMNYPWLGNDFGIHKGHGHLHLIPRYEGERKIVFEDSVFRDEQWGRNYAPYPKRKYADTLLFALRDRIRRALSQVQFPP